MLPPYFLLALFLGTMLPVLASAPSKVQESKLIPFLQSEIKRNLFELNQKDSLPPYFIAYRVHDSEDISFRANKGGVIEDKQGSSRTLGVEVRVGSPAFDNTHPLRENLDFIQWTGFQNLPWPKDENQKYQRKSLRTATDFAYRAARDGFTKIRTNVSVRPEEGDTGLDFSASKPVRSNQVPRFNFPSRENFDSLCASLRQASELFKGHPTVYSSEIDFHFGSVVKHLVSTEGTSLVHRESLGRISIYAETKAPDGMILWLAKDFHFHQPPLHFSKDSLQAAVRLLLQRLDSLRNAPVVETYAGPVILKNLAAGVFLHEVFGHRAEGHRQKVVDEGQTFTSKVDKSITRSTITVMDNPSLENLGSIPLNGFYRFDDEGVPSQATLLIDQGILKTFLFSRSVLSPKGVSNGHGRANLGLPVVARMGNTLLLAKEGIPFSALRDSLRALLRLHHLPFGFVLHDISGGFTYTTRDLPQTFRLEPLYVTRVFADERPDDVVRGLDVVGTPLQSLSQIAAVGDDPSVFNGYCGAESGWVPVSASSPSLLLYSMEFEKRAKDQNLSPILSPPGGKP